MTRSTKKNLAAYEGTWFGNIHGNNLRDPWPKKEVSHDRLVGSSSPPSPTTQSCANGDFPVHAERRRTLRGMRQRYRNNHVRDFRTRLI
jgi:hypothetical protein